MFGPDCRFAMKGFWVVQRRSWLGLFDLRVSGKVVEVRLFGKIRVTG
jgi:hypothetical protein